MKHKGMIDAMFVVRQMPEKYRVKGKKLYLALWIWKSIS